MYILTFLRAKNTVYEDTGPLEETKKVVKGKTDECWKLLDDDKFLCDWDNEALDCLSRSGYSFMDAIVLTMPTLCMVAMSSGILLSYEPIVHCFWPTKARSSATMNAVISCFIIPAGFVYALSFGFMFQFAMEKFAICINKVSMT